MYKDNINNSPGDISKAVKSADNIIDEHKNHEIEFMVFPIIKHGGINILGAERSSGKTRLCIHLAYTIVFESNSFIGYNVNKFGNILLLNLEIPEQDLSCLLSQSKNHFINQGFEMKHMFNSFSMLNYLNTKFDDLKLLIYETKPDLIIIDGYKMLSSLYCESKSIKEISNTEAKDFYINLRSWMDAKPGCTILLTNHTNKGTSQESTHGDILYGPGALQDYADQVAIIRKTKNENERIIITTKNRFSDESESGHNLFRITSNEKTNETWPELIEVDVNEKDCRTGNKSTYTKEQKLEAKILYEQGFSHSEIAQKIGGSGMSKGTISKWKLNGWK